MRHSDMEDWREGVMEQWKAAQDSRSKSCRLLAPPIRECLFSARPLLARIFSSFRLRHSFVFVIRASSFIDDRCGRSNETATAPLITPLLRRTTSRGNTGTHAWARSLECFRGWRGNRLQAWLAHRSAHGTDSSSGELGSLRLGALPDNEPLKNGNQATACRNSMC